MTPGIPENWETVGGFSSAQSIGLATNYTNPVISEDKWTELSSPLHYSDEIEEKVYSGGWHVCINITTVGNTGTSSETAGVCALPDSAYSTVYTRLGAANFTEVKPAILKVIVWRDANTSLIR